MVVRRSSGENSAAMLGRWSVPASFLLVPDRRLRQKRPDEDERDRRDDAGHQRVSPRRVRIGNGGAEGRNGRQACGVRHREPVRRRHEQTAERRERLRVAEHFLAPLRFREQLGEPGHRRHEFDAHADEHETPKDEQHLDRGREARYEGGDGVDQDAVGQHAPPSEAIGQIPAEQAEDTAGKRGDVEHPPDPHLILGRSRHRARQLQQGRTDNERQHQDFVDVEGEADRGNRADQPLDRRQPSRSVDRSVLHVVSWRALRRSENTRVIESTSRWCRSTFTLARA